MPLLQKKKDNFKSTQLLIVNLVLFRLKCLYLCVCVCIKLLCVLCSFPFSHCLFLLMVLFLLCVVSITAENGHCVKFNLNETYSSQMLRSTLLLIISSIYKAARKLLLVKHIPMCICCSTQRPHCLWCGESTF